MEGAALDAEGAAFPITGAWLRSGWLTQLLSKISKRLIPISTCPDRNTFQPQAKKQALQEAPSPLFHVLHALWPPVDSSL